MFPKHIHEAIIAERNTNLVGFNGNLDGSQTGFKV